MRAAARRIGAGASRDRQAEDGQKTRYRNEKRRRAGCLGGVAIGLILTAIFAVSVLVAGGRDGPWTVGGILFICPLLSLLLGGILFFIGALVGDWIDRPPLRFRKHRGGSPASAFSEIADEQAAGAQPESDPDGSRDWDRERPGDGARDRPESNEGGQVTRL